MQHKSIIERVADKIQAFIDTFIESMEGVFDKADLSQFGDVTIRGWVTLGFL